MAALVRGIMEAARDAASPEHAAHALAPALALAAATLVLELRGAAPALVTMEEVETMVRLVDAAAVQVPVVRGDVRYWLLKLSLARWLARPPQALPEQQERRAAQQREGEQPVAVAGHAGAGAAVAAEARILDDAFEAVGECALLVQFLYPSSSSSSSSSS